MRYTGCNLFATAECSSKTVVCMVLPQWECTKRFKSLHSKNWNSLTMLLLTPPTNVPLLVLIISANKATTRRNNAAITELKISWNSQWKQNIYSEIQAWRRVWRAPSTEGMVKNSWTAMETELQQYLCERTLTPSGLITKRLFIVKVPCFTFLLLFLHPIFATWLHLRDWSSK